MYAPLLTLNVNAATIAIANNIPQNRVVATPVPTLAYVAPTPYVAPTQAAYAPPTPYIAPTPAPYVAQPPVNSLTASPQQPNSSQCAMGCLSKVSGCNIKGNISYRTDEKIYHVPGQQYYEQTDIDSSDGERWFCTEAEAVAAGWRKSKR